MSPRARQHLTPNLFGEEAETSASIRSRRKAARPERAPLIANRFVQVALNRPVDCEFTYGVPVEMEAGLAVGARVAVPFGRRREIGVVTKLLDETDLDPRRLRAIAKVLDREPLLDAHLCDLARWVGARYACSVGEALAALLPSALKREKERARVLLVEAAAGVGEAELAEVEERFPKQHRLLRTLLELGGPIELSELTKRLNLSDSPARTLARRGWVRLRRVEAAADPLDVSVADRPRPEQLLPTSSSPSTRSTAPSTTASGRCFCCTASPAAARPRSTWPRSSAPWPSGAGRSCSCPRSRSRPQTVGWFRARFELGGRAAQPHDRRATPRRCLVRRSRAARRAWWSGLARPCSRRSPSLGVDRGRRGARAVVQARPARRATTRATWPWSARGPRAAVCVLGSATPSLETWSRSRAGARCSAPRPAPAHQRPAACRRSRSSTCAWRRAAARGEPVLGRASSPPAEVRRPRARGAGDPVPEPARVRADPVVPGLQADRCAASSATSG